MRIETHENNTVKKILLEMYFSIYSEQEKQLKNRFNKTRNLHLKKQVRFFFSFLTSILAVFPVIKAFFVSYRNKNCHASPSISICEINCTATTSKTKTRRCKRFRIFRPGGGSSNRVGFDGENE